MKQDEILKQKFYDECYKANMGSVEMFEWIRKNIIQDYMLFCFLLYLNKKGLINNHDFDYEKESKSFLRQIKNQPNNKKQKTNPKQPSADK